MSLELRRRLMATNREKYTPIEYISLSGSAKGWYSVNVADGNATVEITATFSGVSQMWAVSNVGTSKIMVIHSNNKFGFGWGYGDAADGSKGTAKLVYENNIAYIYYKDKLCEKGSYDGTCNSIVLFSNTSSPYNKEQKAGTKIYEIKITLTDKTIILLPVLREKNSTYGFLDNEGNFYTHPSFVAEYTQ